MKLSSEKMQYFFVKYLKNEGKKFSIYIKNECNSLCLILIMGIFLVHCQTTSIRGPNAEILQYTDR